MAAIFHRLFSVSPFKKFNSLVEKWDQTKVKAFHEQVLNIEKKLDIKIMHSFDSYTPTRREMQALYLSEKKYLYYLASTDIKWILIEMWEDLKYLIKMVEELWHEHQNLRTLLKTLTIKSELERASSTLAHVSVGWLRILLEITDKIKIGKQFEKRAESLMYHSPIFNLEHLLLEENLQTFFNTVECISNRMSDIFPFEIKNFIENTTYQSNFETLYKQRSKQLLELDEEFNAAAVLGTLPTSDMLSQCSYQALSRFNRMMEDAWIQYTKDCFVRERMSWLLTSKPKEHQKHLRIRFNLLSQELRELDVIPIPLRNDNRTIVQFFNADPRTRLEKMRQILHDYQRKLLNLQLDKVWTQLFKHSDIYGSKTITQKPIPVKEIKIPSINEIFLRTEQQVLEKSKLIELLTDFFPEEKENIKAIHDAWFDNRQATFKVLMDNLDLPVKILLTSILSITAYHSQIDKTRQTEILRKFEAETHNRMAQILLAIGHQEKLISLQWDLENPAPGYSNLGIYNDYWASQRKSNPLKAFREYIDFYAKSVSPDISGDLIRQTSPRDPRLEYWLTLQERLETRAQDADRSLRDFYSVNYGEAIQIQSETLMEFVEKDNKEAALHLMVIWMNIRDKSTIMPSFMPEFRSEMIHLDRLNSALFSKSTLSKCALQVLGDPIYCDKINANAFLKNLFHWSRGSNKFDFFIQLMNELNQAICDAKITSDKIKLLLLEFHEMELADKVQRYLDLLINSSTLGLCDYCNILLRLSLMLQETDPSQASLFSQYFSTLASRLLPEQPILELHIKKAHNYTQCFEGWYKQVTPVLEFGSPDKKLPSDLARIVAAFTFDLPPALEQIQTEPAFLPSLCRRKLPSFLTNPVIPKIMAGTTPSEQPVLVSLSISPSTSPTPKVSVVLSINTTTAVAPPSTRSTIRRETSEEAMAGSTSRPFTPRFQHK